MPDYQIILRFLFFAYGTCIGSFLNVCIIRVPQNISVIRGRSCCPECKNPLSIKDMMPLVSFILLGGKCRYCKSSISPHYPIIEGLTGIMFVLCYLRCGLTAKAIILCFFGSALIAAAGIDQKHTYIPERISAFLVILSVILHLYGQAPPLPGCLSGSLIVAGFMLIISLLTKGGIGGGDIKLFAASGLMLGLGNNVLACFAGYVLAALFYAPLIVLGKLSRKSEIPMVPFFAISIMAAALWGDPIIRWYLSLLYIN